MNPTAENLEANRVSDADLALPLTIPVESIVACALRRLDELDGLDRDEAYLLARLERVEKPERTAALLKAIEDTRGF